MQILRTDCVKVFYFQGPLFTAPSLSELGYLLEDSHFKKKDFFLGGGGTSPTPTGGRKSFSAITEDDRHGVYKYTQAESC